MKFLVKIIAVSVMAITSTFSIASADDMKIALVLKRLVLVSLKQLRKVQKKLLQS